MSEKNSAAVKKPQLAKKRPALANVTNQRDASLNAVRTTILSKTMVPSEGKVAKMKKKSSSYDASIPKNSLPSVNVKSSAVDSSRVTYFSRVNQSVVGITAVPATSCMDISPSQSDAVSSIEKKTCDSLNISDHLEIPGDTYKNNIRVEMEKIHKLVNVDDNITDPQFCAVIASDIYKNLRDSETKKRPSIDYMERVQSDINASMRAVLIDWLVEVAEEYMLLPETLFLAVNYVDRYLSGNNINRQRLQLLGVASMMIATKYEEICAPRAEEFCYVTDNTYSRDEVLQMEFDVLNYLKFEMAAVTARCFLWRFVRAVQGIDEVQSMHLECLASYLSELSLLEYSMLCYAPSLIAASAIFLAKFILNPSKRPWTITMEHYTLYKLSDLRDSVKALHRLCCNSNSSSLPAIREKYSQHKYKFVAKKYCPLSMPPEYFHELSN